MMPNNITTMKLRVAAAAATLLTILSGCGASDVQRFVAATGCEPGPIVIAIPDVSGSTKDQTRPGGPYEQDMMRAARGAARSCGDFYSAPADGNSIGTAWFIDGQRFRQTVGGNEAFGAAARARRADRLLPIVRKELEMAAVSGSDLTGSLLRVSRFIRNMPDTRRELQVVLITDGAINLKGDTEISMYASPLDTDERRQAFIRKLRAAGELPDFDGRATIYLAGVGVGVSDRGKAKDILATWDLMVASMNARLASNDSRLRFP